MKTRTLVLLGCAYLGVLLFSAFMGCGGNKDAIDYNRRYAESMNQPVYLEVIKLQYPQAGWNEVRPLTYVRILNDGRLAKLNGLWGREGEKITTTRGFLEDNECKYCN
jgi:hypothetical protein